MTWRAIHACPWWQGKRGRQLAADTRYEATAAGAAPLLQRAWRGKVGRDAARSRRRALTFMADRLRAVWLAHVKRREHAVRPHRYCSPSHSTHAL